MKLNQISQRCLEIFGIIRTTQLQAFARLQDCIETYSDIKSTTMLNDKGEQLYAIALTEKEANLLSSLVTLHIHRLESLIEEQPSALPTHKEWMYDLEDKLEEL